MDGETRNGQTESSQRFAAGELYEDCAFHPCLCTNVDGDELEGISLIDGSAPRGCSISHCGPQPLTVAETVAIKAAFERYVERRTVGRSIVEALEDRRTS